MTVDPIIAALARTMERRTFLTKVAKVGVVAITATTTMLGLTTAAEAHQVHVVCCHLCYPPGFGDCSLCGCTWCWPCTDPATGFSYQCCECYDGGPCADGGACTNFVACSYYYRTA